jgi:peptide deformylase
MKNSLILILLFSLGSCTLSPYKLLKTKANTYTKSQKVMIDHPDENMPMYVLVISKKLDSTILRAQSEPINLKRKNELTRLLAKRLEITMINEMGVGIAAPQVGILKQMICVQRFDKEGFPNEIYINPVITKYSEEKQDCREGCLSIPGRSDTTKIRALTIDLAYQNLEGEKVEETVSGFTAVIFQHEIDHLNGILYIDHLEQEMKEN